jgi:hypothetical protein
MNLSVRKISTAIALALVLGLPLLGKVTVDFDPIVDFLKVQDIRLYRRRRKPGE